MVSVLIFVLLIQLVQINAAILSTCCVGLDLQTLVHTPNFPSLPQSLSLQFISSMAVATFMCLYLLLPCVAGPDKALHLSLGSVTT